MKFIVAVAFTAFFAVASSKHVGIGTKNLLTDILQNIFNDKKGQLANLNVTEIDLGEYGKIINLYLDGLENLNMPRLDSDSPLSVDISNVTVTLDGVFGSADVDLKNVEVPEIGLLVNGEGTASGSVFKIFGTAALNFKLDGLKPKLVDFNWLYMHADAVNLILAGVDNVDEVNAIIAEKLRDYLNDNLVAIAYDNKPAIIEFVNKILDDLVS